MAFCGIYKIRNKLNGKFYIGSSSNIPRRWRDGHLNKLNKNKHDNQHLQNSWNKYGKDTFEIEILKECPIIDLLTEEQKYLNEYVGTTDCYNIRKDAICPAAPGEKRAEWIVKKCGDAQRGRPRWTEEQKKQMSIDRRGNKHTPKTIEKFKNRPKSCYTGIIKAQNINVGRIYSNEHRLHISEGKLLHPRVLTENVRNKISDGVKKAILEGRYHKNKVPINEYDNIKTIYLSGTVTKRQLASKYGINPSSMSKLLKRIGI